MSNASLSAASYRRTLDACLAEVFATERKEQNARLHFEIEAERRFPNIEALSLALATLKQAQGDRSYAVGIADMAAKLWAEAEKAEIAEAAEYRSTLANGTQAEVLPFTVNAWDA